MAALHSALKVLEPVDFEAIPLEDLKKYLVDVFSSCETLLESVPMPSLDGTPTANRSRSQTVSSTASNASEMSLSSARSAPPSPEHAALQQQWGKAIKPTGKDNPLGMTVYKLPAKDGRGSWFARRSVHEGMGFQKWKSALRREFPMSLEKEGGPGEGNIRGIGGERRVEEEVVRGVGKMEVYQLSAQFPGPTAPRDFVTLLLTSSLALDHSICTPDTAKDSLSSGSSPRHYVVVSKPCRHPDCPPREGYVRGVYESIECIREVPMGSTANQISTAALDLASAPAPTGRQRANTGSLEREAVIRNASRSLTLPVKQEQTTGLEVQPGNEHDASAPASEPASAGRKRGKTISFATPVESSTSSETTIADVDGAGAGWYGGPESNPVEWTMITRSDPGGNVPRWMVERGTPAGIIGDATKFLDWACKLDAPATKDDDDDDDDETEEGSAARLEPQQSASKAANISTLEPQGGASTIDKPNTTESERAWETQSHSSSELSSIASFATASSKAHERGDDDDEDGRTADGAPSALPSGPSDVLDDGSGSPAVALDASDDKGSSKLQGQKRKMDAKLAATRSKILSAVPAAGEPTPKHQATLAKAEERHRKEMEKHERRYQSHMLKLEAKRERQTQKDDARRRKQEDKDERSRLMRERDELKGQVEKVKKEMADMVEYMGELQSQNTHLIMKLGKVDAGALHEALTNSRRGRSTSSLVAPDGGVGVGGGGGGSTRGSIHSASNAGDGKSN